MLALERGQCYYLISPNQEANKMQESISISHTGLEIVSGKYYAYHDFGQFEITHAQKLNLDWDLRSGSITMAMKDYNAMSCEKITY